MRRLGRWSARLVGPWRPGVGVAGLIALLGGLVLLSRGAVLEGALLLLLGAGLAVSARRRAPRRGSPETAAMSMEEARSLLGVGPDAPLAEIESAYRRLMRRVHPDVGGAAGLAIKLNLARARLRSEGG